MGTRQSILAAAFVAALAGISARGAMVRDVPEVRVPCSGTPAYAFTVFPAKLSEDALRNGAAEGGTDAAAAIEGVSADIALSWDGGDLLVSVASPRRAVSGEVALWGAGRVARAAIGPGTDATARLPLAAVSGNGAPPDDLRCAFDLAWEGVGVEELRALPREARALYVHTSMAALTDIPAFRFNPHLPHPSSWGHVRFAPASGEGAAPARTGDGDGLVADFSTMDCPRGSREVDGDLGDWPADAFSSASLLPGIAPGRYGARFATAFDEKFLYVAAKFTRPCGGPPENTAPAETGAGYGGGDALQVRIAAGRDDPRSFCAWMAPGGPALTMDTPDPARRDLLAAGARLAFGGGKNGGEPAADGEAADADGEEGGTAMELAIPWNAIGRRPADGDEWRMTFQPWWNAVGDRFLFFAPIVLQPPAAKTVEARNPREGAVSLGVFDASGRLVRTLLKADWRAAGTISVPWDLKDQRDEFVEPGEYALKGLVTGGVSAEYRHTLLNPGNPPWPTSDGTGDWLSDEAPPQGAATDGERVFLAAPGSEKGFAVMALGPDGRKIWGVGEEFYPRCVSLSYLDGRLYALFSGPVIDKSTGVRYTYANAKECARGRAVVIVYDAATGRRVGFSARNARAEVGERWPYREEYTNLYELISAKAFAPENYIGQPRYWDQDVGETDNAIGLAALPGLLAVSKFYDGRIEFYDIETLERRGEVAVPAPAGLCRAPDGSLLAISGKTVARIAGWGDPERPATVETVVASGLAAPVALCADRAGNLYVSDWAGEMRVKKFGPDGAPLGAIGKAGGRPWTGAFDREGMLLPHGLAVTDAGTLYVAEADMLPMRVSAWDAATGAFVRHWIGPTSYGGMTAFWVDPREKGFFHAMGCKFSWDEKTGAWDIAATEIRRMSHDQPFMPSGASCMGTGVRVVRRGDTVFLCVARRNETVWLRKDGDIFTPCAAVGGLHSMVTDDGTGVLCWDSDIGRHLYRNRRPDCFRGHSGKRGRAGDNFSWADTNGDGLVQPEEMAWCETLTRGDSLDKLDSSPEHGPAALQCEFYNGWGAVFASDGTARWAGFARNGDCIWGLEPLRWTAIGPEYDIRRARVLHREAGEGSQWSGVWTTDDGCAYVAGAMRDGRSVKARSSILALAPDGTERWSMAAPKSRQEKDLAASGVNGEWAIPGIGRVLCSWNWWWNYRPYFFTDDGLYVGTFGEETSLGPAALWGESATYFWQTADGRPMLVNGANQHAHVFEVMGLDGAMRFDGAVAVTAEDVAAARESAAVAVAAAARRPPPKAPLRLDGTPVSADGGKGRAWRISLSAPRGARVLRVEADVDDPTPMRQAGTDPRTLFITGDCVDVMLATREDAPKGRHAPAAGDIRLLFSELDGRGAAVLFEPVTTPRAERPERLMACEIDRISVLASARVDIVRRKDGYTLSAEVPLADIGLDPDGTGTLRGDTGVVFGGEGGGRELRLYHYNRDTAMTSDLTTEATLQPHEWGPVLRPQGANLVPDPTFGFGATPFLMETTNHLSIGQSFPLPEGSGGRMARIRALLRAEGLKTEDKSLPGKPAAYITAWFFPKDAQGRPLPATCAFRLDRDLWDWATMTRQADIGRIDPPDAIDLPIPEGAASVTFDFKLTTRGQPVPARVWIDAFEFTVQ